jgi:CRP/FNR family cyclic AMP-dependent transcriptional regulator
MMTILFQFLIVKFLLRQFGIINCLMILSCLHMIMSILFYSTGYGLFAGHTLFIIATASFFQDTLTNSLDLPSRELLFLPLPFPVRVRAQAIMGGMIMPLGQGIGGLLIISLTAFGMPLFQFSLFVLFFAIVRVAILFLERPRYRDTLVSSLKSNQLDATKLRDMVQGSNIDFVLEELLKSSEEQVVSFTLDLLKNRSPGGLSIQLQKLALGSKHVIAAKAIELLGIDGNIDYLDTLNQALASTSDAVRDVAVLAFCRIQKEKALERVRQWLGVPGQVVRSAALVGCGRYCGQAGIELIRPILERMVFSPTPEERITAARLLRDMRNPAHALFVENLLDDLDINVRIAAVEACGTIQALDLVPHLLQLFKSTEMRPYVLRALEQMPEECIPMISETTRDLDLDEAACDMLLQVLASIGGRAAQKVLWDLFSGVSPLAIRVAAGSALRRMAMYGRLQEANEAEFDVRLRFLCEEIELLIQGCKEIGDKDEIVWQLMRDHARLDIECLFQLLAFKYNFHQAEKVRDNFFSSSAIQRANALELLDDILPRRIAPGIVQLLDSFFEKKTSDGKGLSKGLAQQFMKKETWLRVVTAYHLNSCLSDPQIQAGELLTENEKVLYKLLGRILFLKKVPLFKEVPGNYLVPLAKIAHAVRLKGGETLFHQGDRGDAMYLIGCGSISIQVKGVEIDQVGVENYLGEMSLLDGRPRSASCVAREDTELLRISINDFETMVKSQTSVALAVLRTLAARLRQQTANPIAESSLEGEKSVESPLEGGKGVFLRQEITPGVISTDYLNTGFLGPETQAGELLTESEKDLYRLLEKSSFLKKVPLFKEISENYLIPLAKIVHSVRLKGGETLFHQGDRGDALYLIRFGSINVQVNGVEVNRMGAGEYLGEMALLDDTPRSASCIAIEDTELLKIKASDFETVVRSQPSVVFAMIRTLAERLRQQTADSTKKQDVKIVFVD